jgi:phosphohistidine swiveling domain-containing protein
MGGCGLLSERKGMVSMIDGPAQPKEIDHSQFQKWVGTGNFWFQEVPLYPLTVNLITRKTTESDWFEFGVENGVWFFEEEYAHQALNVEESVQAARVQINLLHDNPGTIDHFLSEWNSRTQSFEKTLGEFGLIEIEKLSQGELVNEFNRFNNAAEQYFSIAYTIESYAPFIDQYYYPRFEKEVGDPQKAREAFSTLTVPDQSSFVIEEAKDLKKIALTHVEELYRKDFLETETEKLLFSIKETKPDFFAALKKHQEKYYWMQNSYAEWTVLTTKDFLNFLKDILKTTPIQQLAQDLAQMESSESIQERQKSIARDLGISTRTAREIEFIKKITWLHDDRKRIQLMVLHRMFRFIHEFSRRTGIPVRHVSYCSINEIPDLLDGHIAINVLKQRRKICLFVEQSGNKETIITGKKAFDLKQEILTKNKEHTNKEFLGIVASTGSMPMIRGRVKVVLNPKESITEDEILVTSMTRPEFVPLMKTAKAIITNEGGITCHAAIVSRELNKPCIIGTKNATRYLQTGDEIEMKMSHGMVKIIKRNDGEK